MPKGLSKDLKDPQSLLGHSGCRRKKSAMIPAIFGKCWGDDSQIEEAGTFGCTAFLLARSLVGYWQYEGARLPLQAM